jgi:hypothetical protein
MKTSTRIILAAIVIAAIGGASWYFARGSGKSATADLSLLAGKEEVGMDETLPYLHPDRSFSFRFPATLAFNNLAEDLPGGIVAETVVFTGKGAEESFQIYVAPYDGGAVTASAIARDNPTLEVKEPIGIAVAGERGVVFLATEKGSNFTTREIWFASGGKIYQISTYPSFDTTVASILETWRWQ